MANARQTNLLLLLFAIICAAHAVQGTRTLVVAPYMQKVRHSSPTERQVQLKGSKEEEWPNMKIIRRMMIGSTAPTCTYNECRGCKYKCRAEQVPVEGNDPINSPYHYKCVCHR